MIMNKYLIVGLFQELSARSYDVVDNYQEYSIFYYSDQDTKDAFARFIINHFDRINFNASPLDNSAKLLTPLKAQYDELREEFDLINEEEEDPLELQFAAITLLFHKII